MQYLLIIAMCCNGQGKLEYLNTPTKWEYKMCRAQMDRINAQRVQFGSKVLAHCEPAPGGKE